MTDKPQTMAEANDADQKEQSKRVLMINKTLFMMIIFTFGIAAAAGWAGCLVLHYQLQTSITDAETSAQANQDAIQILTDRIQDVTTEKQKVIMEKKACLKKIADPSIRNKTDMVEYIVWRYPNVPKELAAVIAEHTEKITTEHGIDFTVVVGLMDVESAFNPFAKSKAEARGLLQVMYKTWGKTYKIKKPSDLHDIEYGIDIGVQILKHYLEKNKGSIAGALRNYNGSKGDEFVNRVYVSVGKFTAFRNNTMNGKEEVTDDKTKKLQDSGSANPKK